MRFPLRHQIFLPSAALVVIAALASGSIGGWLAASAWRRQQTDSLTKVVETIRHSSFPLTQKVLEGMAGLSNHNFLVLNDTDQVELATAIDLAPHDLAQMLALPIQDGPVREGSRGVLQLTSGEFLAQRISVGRAASGGSPRSLVVLSSRSAAARTVNQMFLVPIGVALAASLIAAGLAAWLAARIARPLDALRAQAAEISSGNFCQPCVATRDDEIGDVALAIGTMARQLADYESQVRRQERLNSLGQLGAGLAHQLRNAVTGARLALELHERDAGAPEAEEPLGVVDGQLRLIEQHVKRFFTLGQPWHRQAAPVDLREAVAESIRLMKPAAVHAGIDLRWRLPPDEAMVLADGDALVQLVVNLLANALEAAGGTAKAAVQVEIDDVLDGWTLSICDTGPGPPAHLVARLFEPLVSGRPSGTGLELTVAREIAQGCGGQISWRRAKDRTLFEVRFPKSAEQRVAAVDEAVRSQTAGGVAWRRF